MNNTLIVIAGQANQEEVFDDIYIIDLETGIEDYFPNIISVPLYSSACATYGKDFYTFSGLSEYGYSANAAPIYYMYEITVELENIGCGNGQISIDDECLRCDPGFYSSDNGLVCLPCSEGTYSNVPAASDISQCLSCPYGYFNDEKNASKCKVCKNKSKCQVGSQSDGSLQKLTSYLEDSQPKIYKPCDTNLVILVISIVFMILLTLAIILFFVYLKFQVYISVYDIFNKEHIELEPEGNEDEPKAKVSYYGGLCTIITIICVLFELCIYIAIFAYGNVEEVRTLVPVHSFIQEYGSFKEIPLNITVTFNSYRGNCTKKEISWDSASKNIKFTKSEILQNEMYCQFYIYFETKYIIKTGDFVKISVGKYTSDMQVAVSTKSSIPKETSRATGKLISSENRVFIGGSASIFEFSASPAIYEEEGYFDTTTEKGYRIALNSSPIPGSTLNYQYSIENTGFIIQVNFVQSTSGTSTFRKIKTDWTTFLGSTVGALLGLIGIFAFVVYWIEWLYYCLVKKKTMNTKGDLALQEYNDRLEKKG